MGRSAAKSRYIKEGAISEIGNNGISPHRINCKRCPTYQITHGHGSTACIPCQQRGLFGKAIPPPTDLGIPYATWAPTIWSALIEDIRDQSVHLDVLAVVRLLPPRHAAVVTLSVVAGLTQTEIARLLMISRQRVSILMRQAGDYIRQSTRSR